MKKFKFINTRINHIEINDIKYINDYEEVDEDDSGWYTCLVINNIDQNHKSAYLSVIPEPVSVRPQTSNESLRYVIMIGSGILLVIFVCLSAVVKNTTS